MTTFLWWINTPKQMISYDFQVHLTTRGMHFCVLHVLSKALVRELIYRLISCCRCLICITGRSSLSPEMRISKLCFPFQGGWFGNFQSPHVIIYFHLHRVKLSGSYPTKNCLRRHHHWTEDSDAELPNMLPQVATNVEHQTYTGKLVIHIIANDHHWWCKWRPWSKVCTLGFH